MKKSLFLLSLLLFCNPAFARIATVKSVDDFSTKNHPETIKVQAVKDFTLTKDVVISSGNIIEGQIKVKSPKRLKRNATFSFTPVKYIDSEQNVYKINNKYTGNYISPIDKSKLVKSAAAKVGNTIVPGVSTGYNLIKGVVQNEEGNIVKSAATSLYDNSPLSFLKKGNDIEIKKDEEFKLFFKPVKTNITEAITFEKSEKELYTASPEE